MCIRDRITVEVVTVVLLMLALNFLPQWTPRQSSTARHWRDGILSAVAGLAVAVLAYAMMMRDAGFDPISAFHLAQSKPCLLYTSRCV